MKRSVSLPIAISSGLLLFLQTSHSPACATGSASITNLPAITGSGYQVFDLNGSGQLTGFFFVSGVHPGQAFFYSAGMLTDLGTLGGSTSEGHWINASGQIVGKADLAGDTQSHAFLFNNGSMFDLGTLGGPTSTASAINDAGVIIGDSDLPGGAGTSAFVYANGLMTGLGNFGSNYSSAVAINSSGLIVGAAGIPSGDLHAFSYSSGTLLDLGTLGGTYSSAFAVNDSGEVVGESSISTSDIHGFVVQSGIMSDVGTFGGTYSSAYLVNSNGQAVGVANTTGDAETHGFMYSGGTLTDLGTLGGIYSVPFAMNNLGQVVGESLMSSGDYHAFLWANGKLTDLNTVLPSNSGWELVNAFYINDAGRVVGVGNYAGLSQWFILDLAGANTAPVALAGPDQVVDCQAQATLDGSGSYDSDNDSLVFQWSSGGTVLGTNQVLTVSLPLGTNVVTLQVTDSCGLSSQTNVTVIVADTTPPTGSCPAPVTVSADGNCQASVPNLASQVIATDNCAATQDLTITQSPLAGTLVGLGPHPVTITVSDPSGNSSTCSVLFTVADTTPPTIVSIPAAFSLSAGSDCQAAVPNLLPNVVASDSCTPASQLIKTQSPAAGSLIGTGSHSVLIAVTDGSGNTATANVPFTVADTTPPTFLSGPGPIKLSADSNCQGTVPNVLSAVLATDNCTPTGQILLTQNPAAGTVLPHGFYTVVVTAKDASGNSSTLSIPLEIDDTTPPTILSGPTQVTVSAGANGQAFMPNILTNIVATDNCTPVNQLVLVQNPAAGTVLSLGQYTMSIAVTDLAGNTASVTIPLSVVDTTPPVIQSLAVSPNVLSPPNHQIVPVTVSATVADNCDPSPKAQIVSISCSEPASPGDIQITGSLTANLAASKDASGTTRTYTITVQSIDASGNSSIGTVTVTVPKSSSTTVSGGSGTTGTGAWKLGTVTTGLGKEIAWDDGGAGYDEAHERNGRR